MKRVFVRTLGFCVSIFGILLGRNGNALVDDSVWMQCEYSSDYGHENLERNGGSFQWAACDDYSDYILVGGRYVMDNYPECNKSVGILPLTTGMHTNDDVMCYCNYTGLVCPNTPIFQNWLRNQNCEEGDVEPTGITYNSCYTHKRSRGLYLVFDSCWAGYAEPTGVSLELTGVATKYYLVTGAIDQQIMDGYCYKCPALGYSGDSFYTYTPANGVTSSGQISWAQGQYGGCHATINGSITNSMGTFVLPEGCNDY